MIGVIVVVLLFYSFIGIVSCAEIIENIRWCNRVKIYQALILLFYFPITILVIILYILAYVVANIFAKIFNALSKVNIDWLNKTIYK